MDIQQYISSGVIEAYVLGIASEEEVQELELLSAAHPEIAAAIADYRQTLDDYAGLHVMMPPPDLKANIWAQLSAESPAAQQPEAVTAPTGIPATTRRRLPLSAYLAAASLLLLLGSLALNINLWNDSRSQQQELARLNRAQEQLSAANKQNAEQLAAARQWLQLATDPAVKTVLLAGVGEHSSNSAFVLWDSNSKQVYLSLKQMPPPPAGQQYQLWAIVDGQPVDLGVYGPHEAGHFQQMKAVPAAQMFAITLEKEGGSPSPTLSQMFVAGKT